VLDCWENEPRIRRGLLAHPQVVLATPHIAGHSLDGKAANTEAVHRALCRHLGIPPCWSPRHVLPDPGEAKAIATGHDPLANLRRAALALYDIERDDRRLRACLDRDDEALAAAFARLRRHYPPRRAWAVTPVRFVPPHGPTQALAAAIGMRLR